MVESFDETQAKLDAILRWKNVRNRSEILQAFAPWADLNHAMYLLKEMDFVVHIQPQTTICTIFDPNGRPGVPSVQVMKEEAPRAIFEAVYQYSVENSRDTSIENPQ